MQNPTVTLSSKFQVVIPKTARQKLGLKKSTGQQFTVARVTENEIVFRKAPTLDDFLGKYDDAFVPNAVASLRKQRASEWDR